MKRPVYSVAAMRAEAATVLRDAAKICDNRPWYGLCAAIEMLRATDGAEFLATVEADLLLQRAYRKDARRGARARCWPFFWPVYDRRSNHARIIGALLLAHMIEDDRAP